MSAVEQKHGSVALTEKSILKPLWQIYKLGDFALYHRKLHWDDTTEMGRNHVLPVMAARLLSDLSVWRTQIYICALNWYITD